MKAALTLLAVGTLFVSPSLSALQSGGEPTNPAIRAGISESDSEMSADVQLLVARGDLRRRDTCRAGPRGWWRTRTTTPAIL